MAFVMDFAEGDFKDILELHMVENGYICGTLKNGEYVKRHQLNLARFLVENFTSKHVTIPFFMGYRFSGNENYI